MVKLGDKVRDSITGFEGIVVARAEYLNGCISLQVQSAKLKDDSPIHPEWFDEQRLTNTSKATVGGPQSYPPELHP